MESGRGSGARNILERGWASRLGIGWALSVYHGKAKVPSQCPDSSFCHLLKYHAVMDCSMSQDTRNPGKWSKNDYLGTTTKKMAASY